MTNTRTGLPRIAPRSRTARPARLGPAETVNIPVQLGSESVDDHVVDDAAPQADPAVGEPIEQPEQLDEQLDKLDEQGTHDLEEEGDADDMGKHSEPLGAELDADPETSLVPSLCLHMLSEHNVRGALHLDEVALAAEHDHLHQNTQCNHAPDDLRFRPRLAQKNAMLIREDDQDESLDEADANPLPV